MSDDLELQKMKITAWNTAMGATNRLNGLFDMCAMFAMNLDAGNWYMTLKQLEREIDCKMTDSQRTLFKISFRSIHEDIQRYNQRRKDSGIESDLYDQLDDIEKQLRRIADAAGLLVPKKLNFSDTFEDI